MTNNIPYSKDRFLYYPKRKLFYGLMILSFWIFGLIIFGFALFLDNHIYVAESLLSKHFPDVAYFLTIVGFIMSKLLSLFGFVTLLYTIPAVFRFFSRKYSFIFTPMGIEEHTLFGVAYIPWSDIQKVGIIEQGLLSVMGGMIGIRVTTYENILKTSTALNSYITRVALFAPFAHFNKMPLFFGYQFVRALLFTGLGITKLHKSFDEDKLASITTLGDIYILNRYLLDYDIVFSGIHIQITPEDFIEDIIYYYRNYAEVVDRNRLITW